MKVQTAGKYLAIAHAPETVDWGKSNNGTDQFVVTFTILDATTKEPTDVQEQWIGNLANKTSCEIAARALRAMGWVGDDMTDLTGIDRNIVELDIQPDTYNGVTRLKTKWVNVPGGGGIVFKNKLDEDGKKAAAARMRAMIAGNASLAAPAGGAAASGGKSLDDIIPDFGLPTPG
jgi:hypothetical protein